MITQNFPKKINLLKCLHKNTLVTFCFLEFKQLIVMVLFSKL